MSEQFTLDRVAHADDTVTVTLRAYTYGDTQRRDVASVRTPAQFSERSGEQVVESDAALRLVHEHVGENYSPVWQGCGWTVELAAGYCLFATNG